MDNESKDYFGFDAHSGGYFPFEGVMDNNKEIDKIIVNKSNSTATINYADGCSFTVSATITKSGNDYIFTNIQKSWIYPQNNN